MLKKFLAVMAIVGVMTSSVSALTVVTEEGESEISNLRVSPSTFNPEDGETAQITFSISGPSEVYAYVVDSSNNIRTTFANFQTTQAGNVSYTWRGTVGNTSSGNALPDGNYTVKVFTTDEGTFLDDAQVSATIDTDNNGGTGGDDEPTISNLRVVPASFSPEDGEETEIRFSVDETADLEVVIKDGNSVIRTFNNYEEDSYSAGSHEIVWDGEDDDGDIVDEDEYTVEVRAENNDGVDTETVDVEVVEDGGSTGNEFAPRISNLRVNPSEFSPEDDEETDIRFEVDEDSYIEVTIKSGNNVVKRFNNYDGSDFFDADDDHFLTWDGENTNGNIVNDGTYTVNVRAFNSDGSDVESVQVFVDDDSNGNGDQDDEPSIYNLRAVPQTFSPQDREDTDIRFGVDEDADIEVVIKRGSSTIRTFTNYNGNDFYIASSNHVISWDGRNSSGSVVSEGNYTVEVTAENSEGEDTETYTVRVDRDGDDDDDNDDDDIIEDFVITPWPRWNPRDEDLEIEFELTEDNVDLLVEAREEDGNGRIEIEDDNSAEDGDYRLTWDGRDEDNDYVDEGDWEIVVIADGEKVTETVEIDYDRDSSNGSSPNRDDDDDDDNEDCQERYWDIEHLDEDNELCRAIEWVTEEGIFHGYPDGAFRAYQNINRAEVLKVILEAFDDVNILPADGTKQGFTDVDPNAWYMTYVRTGKFYNMVHGYGDGTVRLQNTVNRVELLKLALEASGSFTSYEFVNGDTEDSFFDDVDDRGDSEWFYDYATAAHEYNLYDTYILNGKEYLRPSQLVERGEVALLLYRMNEEGLLDD